MMITGVIETFAICHLYLFLGPWFSFYCRILSDFYASTNSSQTWANF